MGAAPDLRVRWFHAPKGMLVVWAGILAGPLAWILDLTASYALVPWVCGGGSRLVLHGISGLSLSMVGLGAWCAWTALRQAAGTPVLWPQFTPDRVEAQLDEGARPDERGRFMARLGLATCAMFAALVVAGAVPRWMVDACLQ